MLHIYTCEYKSAARVVSSPALCQLSPAQRSTCHSHARGKLLVVAGQKLQSAGVVVDMFPLHSQEKLRSLCEAWYSGNQLSQPLGEQMHVGKFESAADARLFVPLCPVWSTIELNHTTLTPDTVLLYPDSVNEYFGNPLAYYFSFLDFYTWSLLPPAVLGLAITYFSGQCEEIFIYVFICVCLSSWY